MALVILNPGSPPLGQFDGYDNLSLKGGEVVFLNSVVTPQYPSGSVDLGAYDVFDGYAGTTNKVRPVVGLANAQTAKPWFLADEGTANYGTLFGTLVGGTAGQVTTASGTVIGPSTMAGSGKVTLWDKPGLYGVTLDAVDTTANTGLVVGNSALQSANTLSFTSAGLLTPASSGQQVSGAPVVARFVEFATKGSLVTTPNSLVSALNSPSSPVQSLSQRAFYMAVIYWMGVAQS